MLSFSCFKKLISSKEYGEKEGKSIALDNINLSIYNGELLIILGSSGSGKSTLLNMIGGMDYPTSGSLMVNGENIADYDDVKLTNYRKDVVSYIYQSFNLLQELSAKENVEIVMDERNEEIVNEVFGIVGLTYKMDKYPKELSGGEQQRVSIARALAKQTDILLCDEPTGALDYESGMQILH